MKKLIFFLLLVFAMCTQLKAQACVTCSITIKNIDTLNYTVNAGQTFCVDTIGIFTGTITINGGTICNKGFFGPRAITFNTGTIDNYANLSLPTSVVLSNNKLIYNKPSAFANVTGSLTISGGVFTNNGIATISQNITNTSGTVNNTGILNCTQLIGTNTLTNTGVINSN